MQHDVRGLELSTASAVAAQHIDQAVSDFLNYLTTASAQVKLALEEDPDFVLALCFRGYFLMMLENRAVLPKVQETLDKTKPHLGAVTPRERLHVKALEAWAAGDLAGACLSWEELLTEAPRDLLALKLHHTMTFYTGRSHVLRAVVSSVLGAWDETVPGYGFVQGMYAYALEENGDYAAAERWGREAYDTNPEDLWAIHSVAHVMEMQGRSAEGTEWLDYSRENWAHKNPFKAHVWWHAALFALAQGDYDRALNLYDNELLSVNSKAYVDVSNQAALLKRLEIAGIDVGDRWDVLAEHAETRIEDHMLPFRDVHFCLALAAQGNIDGARRQIASMRSFAEDGEGWTAKVTGSTLIPLCEGLVAYETGDYGTACDMIWPMRNELGLIGGSHAQRDLFAQILSDTAQRGSRLAVARGLLAERVARRPSSRGAWLQYSTVLRELGESEFAELAERNAATATEAG